MDLARLGGKYPQQPHVTAEDTDRLEIGNNLPDRFKLGSVQLQRLGFNQHYSASCNATLQNTIF